MSAACYNELQYRLEQLNDERRLAEAEYVADVCYSNRRAAYFFAKLEDAERDLLAKLEALEPTPPKP